HRSSHWCIGVIDLISERQHTNRPTVEKKSQILIHIDSQRRCIVSPMRVLSVR
ncbi:hypothetical protein V2G26_015386, partial [Clonostachys chloroleuca]